MAYLPLNYDKINLMEGMTKPSEIKYRSASFDYWVRSLFERLTSNLIFGLPDFWRGDIENFWYYSSCMFSYKRRRCYISNGKLDTSDLLFYAIVCFCLWLFV